MPAAFVEHRPRNTDPMAETKHYTYVVNGTDSGTYPTQEAAKNAACAVGLAQCTWHGAALAEPQPAG